MIRLLEKNYHQNTKYDIIKATAYGYKVEGFNTYEFEIVDIDYEDYLDGYFDELFNYLYK